MNNHYQKDIVDELRTLKNLFSSQKCTVEYMKNTLKDQDHDRYRILETTLQILRDYQEQTNVLIRRALEAHDEVSILIFGNTFTDW